MLTGFLVATNLHVVVVQQPMTEKKSSLWKVLIEFLVATNPHLGHSPTTEMRKKNQHGKC